MSSNKTPQRIQYTIEYIDINKNGKIDKGDIDIVKMYVDGKLVQQYIVPHKNMKKIALQAVENNKTIQESRNSSQNVTTRTPRTPRTTKTPRTPNINTLGELPKNIPDPDANQNKPVLVQDKTGFVHYVKAGAGLEAGRLATDAVVNAVSGLFSSGDDGGDEE